VRVLVEILVRLGAKDIPGIHCPLFPRRLASSF
jgi:hypothetical protein